ncbi:Gfo/Idh/MocA family protein [Alkalihalobacillus sp. TS-13]|uniref:Gfo/Idh/MocA family protein n=1 Tax=Alkalihalobacillus sp. TS-13 TaxID=2842455 RepID=UPI001C88A88E|nr:Gfo/Idh/MocA family oxidoreductase [Alkalihalobacillus sp. TS-13]
MKNLKIGMIGLDTSHAITFTRLLNDPAMKHHVRGGRVEVAYPGGSPDFTLSMTRVEIYTEELQAAYDMKIVTSVEEVAEQSDAILLESVDGRIHFEQLRKLAPYGKPVFVDKPFCLSTNEALEMVQIAESFNMPIMSTSALRFSGNLQEALATDDKGDIVGADCFGPIEFQEKQPGYFWYGIHCVEMLYTILGKGVSSVESIANTHHDLLVGKWKDGRIGTVRGNRKGNYQFGAAIHFEKGTTAVDASNNDKPFYASLLEEVIGFFHDGMSRVPLGETVEIIRFVEAANESRLKNIGVLLEDQELKFH